MVGGGWVSFCRLEGGGSLVVPAGLYLQRGWEREEQREGDREGDRERRTGRTGEDR